MLDSPHRSTLFALAALILGTLAALAATALGGAFTVPWWVLLFVLCLVLPRGAASAHSPRGRVAALAALAASSLVFVAGTRMTDSLGLVLAVTVPLWAALTLMITPQLRGHRMLGVALVAAPVVLVGAVVPAVLSGGGLAALPSIDTAAAGSAVVTAAGPLLLVGGAAVLLGTVLDLGARLRAVVSAESLRSVAAVTAGLTLLLVATAGAVAAGTLAGTASQIGLLGVLLVVVALLAVHRGIVGLAATRDVSPVSGVLAVGSVTALLAGAMLAPASPLTTALSLAVLLALAVVLGAVGGLCGAAAVVRRDPAPTPGAIGRVAGALRTLRLPGVRARHAHS